MAACLVCQDQIVPDDVAVLLASRARCICVRCFDRETGTKLSLSPQVEREVAAVLAATS